MYSRKEKIKSYNAIIEIVIENIEKDLNYMSQDALSNRLNVACDTDLFSQRMISRIINRRCIINGDAFIILLQHYNIVKF